MRSAAAVGAAMAAASGVQRRRGGGGVQRRNRAAAVVSLKATIAQADVATMEATAVGDTYERDGVRNIAIIAHVDHGKTTLVDKLMQQTSDVKQESMDSDQIERERGITILAKNAALTYKGVKINLIDTPGHADFGGEVERILNMADACVLLVDAQEGPMPQTKFVLRQALRQERRVLVCINKVDKPAARPDWVLDTTFDLFAGLGANDFLCDFPVCYASGIKGMASTDGPGELQENLFPLLDQILEEVPKPKVVKGAPLQMLVTNLDYDPYVGRICIGRLRSGSMKVGQNLGFQFGAEGEIRTAKISKLWEFKNNGREVVDEISGGDICAFTGMSDCKIGDTVVDPKDPRPLPPIVVEEPTVVMEFTVNSSPLANKEKETQFVTSKAIGDRLAKECLTNLALRVEPGSASSSFRVKGRGTLQLGILLENMRREGYEVMIGSPQVIIRKDPETGNDQEPYEEVVIEVPKEFQGVVLEEMQKKGGQMTGLEEGSLADLIILTFQGPTRGFIGMQGKLANRTKGQAVLNARFSHWGSYDNDSARLRGKGSLVSSCAGKATADALLKQSKRSTLFIDAGTEVYPGMCIGIYNGEEDLTVNITKEKNVTNVRQKTSDVILAAPPPMRMEIDDFLGHMDIDESLEVTPNFVRLCKKNFKPRK